MKRKDFLSSVIPLGATLGAVARGNMPLDDPDTPTTIPPYLKKGDTIGITSPAGFIKTEEIQSAVNKITEWGFTVRIGSTIGKQNFTFGGTDAERRDDLQQLIDDQNVKAILCARGGYGLVRIIDELDFKKLDKHPKWIIGFSDITVLHNALANLGVASLNAQIPHNIAVKTEETKDTLRKEMFEEPCSMGGEGVPAMNRTGERGGYEIGGNI